MHAMWMINTTGMNETRRHHAQIFFDLDGPHQALVTSSARKPSREIGMLQNFLILNMCDENHDELHKDGGKRFVYDSPCG